jgi:pre-rRNA-processing protein IPI3
MQGFETVVVWSDDSCPPAEREARVVDAHTGSTLAAFKGCAAPPNGMCAVGTSYVAAAESDRPSVALWRWGREQHLRRCNAQERLGPVAATSDGLHIVAGGVSGRLFLWEASSGALRCVWDGHFRSVTALSVSDDDAFLITAGADAIVNVWSFVSLLRAGGSAASGGRGAGSSPKPIRVWSGHSQPPRQLHCGLGSGTSCRVYSAGADQTCLVWDIVAEKELHKIACPCALSSVTTDAAERWLFLGGDDGRIFAVDLHHGARAAAVGRAAYTGHRGAVTGLAVTADGRRLLSTSEDGTLRVWDVASRQMLSEVTFRSTAGKDNAARTFSIPLCGCLLGARHPSVADESSQAVDRKRNKVPQWLQPLQHLSKFAAAAEAKPPTVRVGRVRSERGGGTALRAEWREAARSVGARRADAAVDEGADEGGADDGSGFIALPKPKRSGGQGGGSGAKRRRGGNRARSSGGGASAAAEEEIAELRQRNAELSKLNKELFELKK